MMNDRDSQFIDETEHVRTQHRSEPPLEIPLDRADLESSSGSLGLSPGESAAALMKAWNPSTSTFDVSKVLPANAGDPTTDEPISIYDLDTNSVWHGGTFLLPGEPAVIKHEVDSGRMVVIGSKGTRRRAKVAQSGGILANANGTVEFWRRDFNNGADVEQATGIVTTARNKWAAKSLSLGDEVWVVWQSDSKAWYVIQPGGANTPEVPSHIFMVGEGDSTPYGPFLGVGTKMFENDVWADITVDGNTFPDGLTTTDNGVHLGEPQWSHPSKGICGVRITGRGVYQAILMGRIYHTQTTPSGIFLYNLRWVGYKNAALDAITTEGLFTQQSHTFGSKFHIDGHDDTHTYSEFHEQALIQSKVDTTWEAVVQIKPESSEMGNQFYWTLMVNKIDRGFGWDYVNQPT